MSRPVDISPLLSELSDTLTACGDGKQKELLKQEMVEMSSFALSGDVVERQFYLKIWDKAHENTERELLQKLELANMVLQLLLQRRFLIWNVKFIWGKLTHKDRH